MNKQGRSVRLNKALDDISAVSLEIALDENWVSPDVDEQLAVLLNQVNDLMVQAIQIVEGVESYLEEEGL